MTQVSGQVTEAGKLIAYRWGREVGWAAMVSGKVRGRALITLISTDYSVRSIG